MALTSAASGLGTEMHLDWQSTSPTLQAARQAVMAAWAELCALPTTAVVAEGVVVAVPWALAIATTLEKRRVAKRIVAGVGVCLLVVGASEEEKSNITIRTQTMNERI